MEVGHRLTLQHNFSYVVLWQIFTKREKTLTLKLLSKTKKSAGMLSVHAKETSEVKDAALIVFRCANLDNKDILSKCVS